MRYKAFYLILLIGILLRIGVLGIAIQYRDNTDILRWKDWGRISYLYSLADTYTNSHITFGTLPNNMPPGTLYIASTMYHASIQMSKVYIKVTNAQEGSNFFLNSILPTIFLRLPSLVADGFLYFLIFLFSNQHRSKKHALLGASLFFLNPVVIYNSAFWGQMDAINNVLFFAALLFLIRRNTFPAILFFFLSLFVKLSLIVMLPSFFLCAYKTFSRKKLIFATFGTLVTICFFVLPISLQPWIWLPEYLAKNAVGEMQNITAFAFNGWWAIFQPQIKIGAPFNNFEFSEITLLYSPLSSTRYFGIPLEIIAYVSFIILSIPLFIAQIQKNLHKQLPMIFLIFSLLALIGFMVLPRMHERYMYPLFPLLATYIGLTGKFKYYYILFSLLNLVNLYMVWHPMLPPLIPYEIMNNQVFQWLLSLITVTIFILFYIRSIRILYEK